MSLRLGVNIDHVATLRQARGGSQPDPVRAAQVAEGAGANGITLHLREDRRHVQDRDLREIVRVVTIPVNLELAVDHGIIEIALDVRPQNCCLVPERRQELTTEGGLDVCGAEDRVGAAVELLRTAGIQVQLFVDPEPEQIDAAWRIGAHGVELHTGAYANASDPLTARSELDRLCCAADRTRSLGLHLHGGHGLDYQNVGSIAQIDGMEELNIGHAIIARAVFAGMHEAVSQMKRLLTGNNNGDM
jgi:pyridoxine 5-phosphate synthase